MIRDVFVTTLSTNHANARSPRNYAVCFDSPRYFASRSHRCEARASARRAVAVHWVTGSTE
jgi:hypothetical protein